MIRYLASLLIALTVFPFSVPLLSADGGSGTTFVYPFAQIAVPSCRFSEWSTLGDDCRMPIPRIEGANYARYSNNSMYRRIYTVLWEATYDYGWDVGHGSHEGVDIATSLGTPVQAIGDGVVVVAGWESGWGNVISIRHTLADGTNIWSSYAHLSKILVGKWPIHQGDTIGEVGQTGNAYGNHLHFEIDTTDQAHPYYYSRCAKGLDPMAVVNQGLCQDSLAANTVDPIAFLESGHVASPVVTPTPANPNPAPVIETAPVLQPITSQMIESIRQNTQTIDQKTIKSRQEIADEEIKEFLQKYTIRLSTSIPGNNIPVGSTMTATISVSKGGKPFTGSMPYEGISITADPALSFMPTGIIAIEGGQRTFTITANEEGDYPITLRLGSQTIATTTIHAYVLDHITDPTHGSILMTPSLRIGGEVTGGVVFNMPSGAPRIDIPYDGEYTLHAVTGRVKFCNASTHPGRPCDPSELVSELTFHSPETYRGVLVFSMVPLDFAPVHLEIVRTIRAKPKVIATSGQDAIVAQPIDMDNASLYAPDEIRAIQKGLVRLSQGYLLADRELLGRGAKDMMMRSLGYAILRSGDDMDKKTSLISLLEKFRVDSASTDDFAHITRGQLAQMLLSAYGEPLDTSSPTTLVDERGPYQSVITTLRVRYGFAWRDQFAKRYFQPDKKITIGEALSLVEFFTTKKTP